MTREYLKKATLTSASGASDVHETVMAILKDIEEGGDAKAMEYAAKFDKYEGNLILTEAEIEAASALVPDKLKADIQFAHDNVKRFAELQKAPLPLWRWKFSPAILPVKRQFRSMRQAVMRPVDGTVTSQVPS